MKKNLKKNYPFTNGLDLTLLTVGATKFEATNLKGHQSVGKFNDMNQAVQVIRGQNKAVALANHTPTA